MVRYTLVTAFHPPPSLFFFFFVLSSLRLPGDLAYIARKRGKVDFCETHCVLHTLTHDALTGDDGNNDDSETLGGDGMVSEGGEEERRGCMS